MEPGTDFPLRPRSGADGEDITREGDRPAFPIVGIAASAGGLEAVGALLGALPADPGAALVVVLHLSPDRPSGVAEVLSGGTLLPVCEIRDGMRIERDHVYVIAPNTELTMARGALWVGPRPSGRDGHRPADVFLESLARELGHRAIGVVLSGGDADGTEGLRAIQQRGGTTFAQDDTAKVRSMPVHSVNSGVVDLVLAPAAIATELVHLAARPPPEAPVPSHGLHAPSAEELAPELAPELADDELEQIIQLLLGSGGADFTHYKRPTVRRRILRRMGILRIERPLQFIALLESDPSELRALNADILIHVTRFFRDPDAFRALEEHVVRRLVDPDRSPGAIRIWVAGCASGEEAYSITICLLEALGDRAATAPIQVFGTDLSDAAIAKARAGMYSADIASDVSPERLRSFFVKTELGYQISKTVRDLCVFARHDVAHDPPFSHLDLISCRNLLIYLSPPLQKRVLPLLHYGLKPGGHLFLGSAESVGTFGRKFTVVDGHWNLFAKVGEGHHPGVPPAPDARSVAVRRTPAPKIAAPRDIDSEREADRVLAGTYAPPSIVIDDRMEALHFRGRTAGYLEPPQGRATLHLLAMARPGLMAAISAAVHGAIEGKRPSEADARVDADGRDVRIRVTPLGVDAASGRRTFLVAFEDRPPASPVVPAGDALPEASACEEGSAPSRERQEIHALRLQMQALIEGHEATYEELQSANEEVRSSNEELQSTNEELETAKEELQSTNEELSTTNEELQARVRELGVLNDDLSNVLSNAHIPVVIVGPDLRIRRFTAAAVPLFNLIVGDVGRPLSDIQTALTVPDLIAQLAEVLESLAAKTQDVQDRTGRWYTLRLRPYRTRDNRIDGAVLTLVDIDETKRALDYAEAIIATVQTPLLVLDSRLCARRANRAFYRAFHVSAQASEGRLICELGNGQWNLAPLRELLEEVIPHDRHVDDFEVQHSFPDIGPRTMRINARRIEGGPGVEAQILVAIDDLTQQKHQETMLKLADVRKNEFLAMLAHELRNPLAPVVHAAQLLREPNVHASATERALEIITRQTSRMSRLIDDLLDVSRITRGIVELRRQRVDLRCVIDAAIESNEARMAEKRQEFQRTRLPAPIWLDADAVRLEQVISNLLGNAVKYTPASGSIDLRVEREPGWVVVRVRDSGIGVAVSMLSQIFEPFTQERREVGTDGLGIGLTVVRSLVELHGGTVVAHSAGLGLGSEFVVRLPSLLSGPDSAAGRVEAAGAVEPVSHVGPRRRILIVEDNSDAAEALAALLESWGHEVRAVGSGPEALDAGSAQCPEIVLIDVGLPEMSGYEVAKMLRLQPALKEARLVAITGYGQEEDRERSREAGFDAHLVKPVNADMLQQVLEEAHVDG
jgi:two-component system, chemotaxis family, CheB/CheR fusion protein